MKDRKDEKMNYESKKYKEIGERVISKLFPHLLNEKIAWLASDKEKKVNGKIRFAEAGKVSAQYDWCCDYDFTITVFEPNVEYMTDKQIEILLEHELRHIGVKDGHKSILPHDAEEFTEIIRKYGIDWSLPNANIRETAE